MMRSGAWRMVCLASMAAGMMVFLAACELNVSDSGDSSDETENANPIPIPNPDPNPNPNPNPNPDPDPDPDPNPAPGVPVALSPGNGDSFSGAGAKVTFVWTDAEGAEQFELVIQGLAGGGWQGLVDKKTDAFQFTYMLPGQPFTQYRWAVRSISAANVTSAYTAWSSFTWSP